MLQAERWHGALPPRPLPKRTPRPTPDTAIQPSHDAYTVRKKLEKGGGYVPEEFRPIEDVEEEKREKENDPLRKGFVPIEEAPDTTVMNPEEALSAAEQGEEVKLGVISKRKAWIDQVATKAKRETDSSLPGFSPTDEVAKEKAYKIDTRRVSASGEQRAPLLEEKKGGGYYTEKEKRDMLHGRKGPGGSGHSRSRQEVAARVDEKKWLQKIDKQGKKGELARFKFFTEWMESLNKRIKERKFGHTPATIRHHIEEELQRAETLFPDVYRNYHIFIDGQTFEVTYKLKGEYNLSLIGRHLRSDLEDIR